MQHEILQFIRFLGEVDTQDKTSLNLIIARVGAATSSYNLCHPKHKQHYNEQIQQLSDLFAHLYFRKPLKEFRDCDTTDIDNQW